MELKNLISRITGIFGSPPPQVEPHEEKFREAAGSTIDDDEDQWRRLSGDSSRDLAPMTQERMRKVALYLWESNLLANRLVELPLAFLLAEGVTLSCKDPDNQKALNRFWRDPINQMSIKLPKKVRELALYGEQCYPAFVNEVSGEVRLGYLDPALIATVVTDPDNPEQPIGIVTVKDKKGQARRYRVIVNGPEDVFTSRTQEIRQTFEDGEAFFFTVNDLSNGRRGRSDLLAGADWVDGYEEYLFGEMDRSKFLRAFVWDVELTGATPETVNQRAKEIHPPSPGSVRVHNDSEKWNAVSPNLNAADSAEGARLLRNHVLGGGTIPEHWFGGGGDVNRAAASEMGEPTFKVFSMRQQVIKFMLESIGLYVLRQKCLAETDEELDLGEDANQVEAMFPEMTARDTTKYAAALQQIVTAVAMAVEKKRMTEKTAVRLIAAIAGRLGVQIDADAELKAAQAAAAKVAEGDVFTDKAA
ncbi:hypothetical protein AZSI13_32350 [Azospira sp. I13]|uniref:hypothetical protein n=1 Tax=Azospira sp. I13 TaxID=1765050 RepID=UPI000D4D9846|nr:hypothetical protein [Azospira sp. I13]GBG03908.1 hypothetical protein AZSI13_32350 [Azospira sp. I13]